MREYFKPWRRKIGVFTLVIALTAMAGWVRSGSHQDVISFRSGKHAAEFFMSLDHILAWQSIRDIPADRPTTALPLFTNYLPDTRFGATGMLNIHWQWKSFGFAIGELTSEQTKDVRLTFWVARYYSIVIPLTALSAFLLLSKPRQSTQTKTTILIMDEGGAATT